uniref:Myosin motor domain-containing protein n=1 Tax=Parascaris equorum TaxID=6256 RepID=A0A914S9G4_PAREQ
MDGDLQYLTVKSIGLADPALQTEWAEKRYVWIPDRKEGFLLGCILKELSGECLVVRVVETGKEVTIGREDVQSANPPKFEKVEDMSSLSCLNEASVLHNLRQRYYSSLIYVGLYFVLFSHFDCCFGMNRLTDPTWRFFAQKIVNDYSEREDQSILCTGESGAGKTENTKKVIQYLAHIAGAGRHAKNPSTASPFKVSSSIVSVSFKKSSFLFLLFVSGKFIRVNFDQSGYISGANIEHYLLEKSRTLRQAPNERSFHFFYQLLKGANENRR